MKNPKDPRFNPQPGNRLFRSAAQQTQKRDGKVSTLAIAVMITVLFTGTGGAFYYLSKPAAPAQTEAPAPTPTPPMVTPTPTATPTPEPRAARSSDEGESRRKTTSTKSSRAGREVKASRSAGEEKKAAAEPAAEKKASARTSEKSESKSASASESKGSSGKATSGKTARRSETRTASSAREKPSTTKTASKTASKTRVSAAATKTAPKTKTTAAASTKKGSGTKAIVTRTAEKTDTPQVPDKTETASKTTAKKSSTPAVPEDTVVVPVGDQAAASQGSDKGGDEAPQSAPMQRAKFNMRPESERSANTDRVNKLEEFKDVTVKRVIKKAPLQTKGSAQPEVPEVDSGKGREQSALQGGGNAPQVAMNTPAEGGTPAAPEVNDAPDRPHEDYSVQYIGPEVLNPAPPIRRGPGRPYPIPRQAYVRRMPPPPPPMRRAPIVPSATEARRMADDLSQIEDVEVHVVPN